MVSESRKAPSLPINFLGIGAQKSGTTWLHRMLRQHPEIYLPKGRKELMFFDDELKFRQGVEFYARFLDELAGEKAIGEITPGYLWTDDSNRRFPIEHFRAGIPERVKRTLGPDLKFLVLLRSPEQRAISAYFHHIRKGRVDQSEPILSAGNREGIFHMGFYYQHLRKWMKSFPPDQFMIETMEAMHRDKMAFLRRACRFLGVSPDFDPDEMDRPYQRSNYRFDDTGNVLLVEDESESLHIPKEDVTKIKRMYARDVWLLKHRLSVDVSPWHFGLRDLVALVR